MSYMIYLIFAILNLYMVSLQQIYFPITLGGFTGHTVLNDFEFDSSGNLAITGTSTDVSFMPGSNTAQYWFMMYLENAAITYKWAKKITGMPASTYYQFDLSPDGTMALIMTYSPTYLIVFSTTDGSLLLQQQDSGNPYPILCYAGCDVFFFNNKINIIAHCSSWHICLHNFAVDNTVTTRSTSQIYTDNPDYYNFGMVAHAIGNNALYFSPFHWNNHTAYIQSTSQTQTTTMNWMFRVFNTGQFQRLDAFVSGTTDYLFGYLKEYGCAYCFQVAKWQISSTTTVNSYQSYRYVDGSTSATFTDLYLSARSSTQAYLIIYFPQSLRTIFFDMTFGATFSWTQTVIQTGHTLTLKKAQYISSSRIFLGGNQAYNFFATNPGGQGYNIAFIYSTDSTHSSITPPTSVLGTWSSGYYQTSMYQQHYPTNSYYSRVFYWVNQAFTATDFLAPTSTDTNGCHIAINAVNSTTTVNFYIYDTGFSYTPTLNTLYCAGSQACTYRIALETTDATVTLTYTAGTNNLVVASTNTAKDGLTAVVIQKTVFPSTWYSNCVYVTKAFTLYYYYPQIVSVAIPDCGSYNIRTATALTCTIPAFSNDKGLVDSPKLDIVYTLQTSTGSAYTTLNFITYDSTTRVISFQTNDPNQHNTYLLRVVASFFNYRVGTYSVISNTFSVILVDTCLTVTVTPQAVATQYYQIGTPMSQFTFTEWADSLSGICGSFQYTAVDSVTLTAYSFLTLVNADRTIQVLSSSDADRGTKTVKLDGVIQDTTYSKTYTSGSLTFSLILISTTYSYIISASVPNQDYIVSDSALYFQHSTFTSSDPTLTVTYSLTTQDGQTIDSSVYTYFSSNRTLKVYTTLNSKVGTTSMMIKAQFTVPIPYFVTHNFTVNVVNSCVRNLINATQQDALSYFVASTSQSQNLKAFTYNQTDCGPLSYSVTLANGQALPNFLSYNENSEQFRVFTLSPEDVGSYSVLIKVAPLYFHTESQLSTTMTVDIGCQILKLWPSTQVTKASFYLGSDLPSLIPIPSFEFYPLCSEQLTYTSTLINGQPLPKDITLDSDNKRFMLIDNGNLEAKNYELLIIAKANYRVSAQCKLIITVKDSTNVPFNSSNSVKLEPVYLSVKPGTTLNYTSKAIAQYTSGSQSLINPDSLANFLNLNDNTLKVKPTALDQGFLRVYLLAIEDGKLIYQEINIWVSSDSKYSKIKEFTGKISKINQSGRVQIQFGENMQKPEKEINEEVLKLKLRKKDGILNKEVKFTWEVVEFQGKEMVIQLYFEDPLSVSQEVIFEFSHFVVL